MKCSKCSSPEVKHFFRNMAHETPIDLFLCESCFGKMSLGSDVIGVLEDDLILKDVDSQIYFNKIDLKTIKIFCEKCGTTIHDISSKGIFGCEQCYFTFSDLIARADRNIQNPVEKNENIDSKNEIVIPAKLSSLEEKMKNSIKLENYEEAAKIRDEILKIKSEMGNT